MATLKAIVETEKEQVTSALRIPGCSANWTMNRSETGSRAFASAVHYSECGTDPLRLSTPRHESPSRDYLGNECMGRRDHTPRRALEIRPVFDELVTEKNAFRGINHSAQIL